MIMSDKKKFYTFEINPMRDLSFPDSTGERHLETGDYYLEIGTQKVKFELIDQIPSYEQNVAKRTF